MLHSTNDDECCTISTDYLTYWQENFSFFGEDDVKRELRLTDLFEMPVNFTESADSFNMELSITGAKRLNCDSYFIYYNSSFQFT